MPDQTPETACTATWSVLGPGEHKLERHCTLADEHDGRHSTHFAGYPMTWENANA